MAEIRFDRPWLRHKRHLMLGGLLMTLALLCTVITIISLYVNNAANHRVADIRREYREISNRRENKVELLSEQVAGLQKKLDTLPESTASKTADKVKQVVSNDLTEKEKQSQ
ncbi:hypothetical protein [Pantoea sp. A4]|uniref:hypothetical protein n=1 Tax=Pantoea sp. A4 TaxID=1225184 RepID=UPI000376DC64|nr:hypothetical protein [Pantoea sp. A4]